jgi:hypothetical protein
MKKVFFSSAIMLCMVVLFSCKNNSSTPSATPDGKKETKEEASDKPSFPTAIDYNDYIINRQKDIYNYIFKMSDVAAKDPEAAEKVIDEAIPVIEKIIGEIKDMPPYKSDVSFRDAAVPLFEFYKATFDGAYREIIAINKKGDKKTKADAAKQQMLSDKLSKEEASLDIAMKSAQNAFAVSNNMRVQENTELQQKVDNLNK